MSETATIFACDMNALAPADRKKHTEIMHLLFNSVQRITELSDGYAFRIPLNELSMAIASEFIAREKLCCPFFRFHLDADKKRDGLWLSLQGPEGVKPFIQSEIGSTLNPALSFPIHS